MAHARLFASDGTFVALTRIRGLTSTIMPTVVKYGTGLYTLGKFEPEYGTWRYVEAYGGIQEAVHVSYVNELPVDK